MTANVKRADRGEATNHRDAIACEVCRAKIAIGAQHNVSGNGVAVLCSSCVTRRSLHRHFYPACRNERHTDLLDHHVEHCSRATALELLKDRKKAPA